MSNSDAPDGPPPDRVATREQRVEAIKRWARYIRDHPPEIWGEQQNRLVNAQLASARETGLSSDHFQRVNRADETRRTRVEDGDSTES